MFASKITTAARLSARSLSTSAVNNAKVCVIGGAGGIGQPMSMLLKMSPVVSHVSVFDMVGAPGVAADLGHIDTSASVSGHGMSLKQFTGDDQIDNKEEFQAAAMKEALADCDVVVIPAGVPRKPGMTRQDLFEVNANLNKDFANAVADNCPNAMVAIISNPVNSTVPIFAEQMKVRGCYDARKVFGVCTLDLVRANTFIAEAAGIDVNKIHIPVIGGHAGASILPVISQTTPAADLSQETIEALTVRIQNGGTEVVQAKAGAGSATLSMAKAGAQFAISLINAKNGGEGIVECAYVESDVTSCGWFSTPILLGKEGVEENLGLPELNEYEQGLLAAAITELQPSIDEGVDFVKNNQ
jgi:malate dehydrogenase